MKKKFTLDENSITIPKGTDVVLKSPHREEDGYLFKAGTVGRVTGFFYNTYELTLPTGRKITCQRDQLAVQKRNVLEKIYVCQYEYKNLKEEIIYEVIVGSQAWGLSDDMSDTDKRGIFILPFPALASIYSPPDEIQDPECDGQYWEVQKAIYQGLRADANTLETLWSPLVLKKTERGEELIKRRDMFVSKNIYGSFGRYAMSQFKKIKQKIQRFQLQNEIIKLIEKNPGLNMEEMCELLCEGIMKDKKLSEAKTLVMDLYQSFYDRGLIPERGFDVLKEYLRNNPGELTLGRKYRPKNAYNLLRLLYSGINWMKEGEPLIEIRGDMKKELLSIKRGDIPIEDTIKKAQEVAIEFQKAYEETDLPKEPDYERADEFLRICRERAAYRYLYEKG